MRRRKRQPRFISAFPPIPPPEADKSYPYLVVVCVVLGIFVFVSFYFLYHNCLPSAHSRESNTVAIPTLSPEIIKKFLIAYKKLSMITVSELVETERECSICISAIEETQVHQLPECKHFFHDQCIEGWFDSDQKTCPLCRKEFTLSSTGELVPKFNDGNGSLNGQANSASNGDESAHGVAIDDHLQEVVIDMPSSDTDQTDGIAEGTPDSAATVHQQEIATTTNQHNIGAANGEN